MYLNYCKSNKQNYNNVPDYLIKIVINTKEKNEYIIKVQFLIKINIYPFFTLF